jgi:hypothetical protein
MVKLSIEDLKKSENFKSKIRWEVTPRVFFDPIAEAGGDPDKAIDVTHGYMLYVDIMEDRPAIVVMQLKQIISKTVGYLHDAPEDLLKEAMNCPADQKVQGMCPLTGRLIEWFKKELGVS